MKTIQKKMLVQVLLGFLLGRVSIYGMNPVAPAFFAAGFAEGGAVLPVAITILLGMSTVFALDTVLAYGAGMLALWLAADFLKRRRITVKMGHAAFLLAAATWVMSGTRYLLVPYSGTSIFLATLEAVLMLAVTRIFMEVLCICCMGPENRDRAKRRSSVWGSLQGPHYGDFRGSRLQSYL